MEENFYVVREKNDFSFSLTLKHRKSNTDLLYSDRCGNLSYNLRLFNSLASMFNTLGYSAEEAEEFISDMFKFVEE